MKRTAVAVLALVVLLTACGGSSAGLLGGDLYEQACASCHGTDGSGGTGPAVGAGSPAVALTDAQLAGVVTVGPGAMPAFPRLTDEQIDSLVDHLRMLQAP